MSGAWDEQLAGTGVVHELEARCAAHYGKVHALAVCNATMGLYAIALALGLRDREVITTPLTWGGTVAGFLAAGARIGFGDVDPETLALSERTLPRAVGRRTRAILAVDLHGVPANDAALRALADELGLWYVHDAAQSLGARIDGRPAGSMAHVVITSFSPGKALSAGEGAVVTTDDATLYERLLWLTQHPDRQKRELGLGCVNEFALNARMHPAAAAHAAHCFDEALVGVAARAREVLGVLAVVRQSGVARAPDYAQCGLEPSFSRLTGMWLRDAAGGALHTALTNAGVDGVSWCDAQLLPLYRRLEWPGARPASARLPNAESANRRRFELTGLGGRGVREGDVSSQHRTSRTSASEQAVHA
ncbi:MAG: DegT/DnrJ/EryC1/StrS aminotransferase family protein [Gemmatimonadetes bacterium]|nr:DegT/DnrJ/EryC1/StrS aminotransferase family protein [Gemmatimonadota bacterium]